MTQALAVDETIESKVRNFVVQEFLDGDSEDLTDTLDLLQIRVFDSINIMRLVDFLEETFEISIKPDDITEMICLANIYRIVHTKLAR